MADERAGFFARGGLPPAAASTIEVKFLMLPILLCYPAGTVPLAGSPVAVVPAAAGTGALILFRHRANVRRLCVGTERRMGVSR